MPFPPLIGGHNHHLPCRLHSPRPGPVIGSAPPGPGTHRSPESQHALDLPALQAPDTRLWLADLADEVVGTIALVEVAPGHDELRTMRTSPAHRSKRIAAQLLDWALADARSRGVRRVSLETGAAPFFTAAHALHKKAGFVECAPFGKYREDPNSVYMTKAL